MKPRILLSFLGLLFTISAFAQMKPDIESRPRQSTQRLTVEELAESMEPLPVSIRPVAPERRVDHFDPKPIPALVRPQSGHLSSFMVMKDPRYGRPYWISGQLGEGEGLSMEEQCREWLGQLGEVLEIDNAKDAFAITHVQTDDIGQQHMRLQQYWQDVPVYGGELIAHFNDGALFLLNGQSYPTPSLTSGSTGGFPGAGPGTCPGSRRSSFPHSGVGRMGA